MRVLALTNLFPNPWQPQRAAFTPRQLRILNRDYCPVRVISPISWTDEFRARRAGKPALPPGRRVTLDGMTIDHPRAFQTPGMLRSWYGRLYYWSVKRTFQRVLREFKPTIVYAPWIYPDGWAAIKLARESGLPVVLKAHGSDVLLVDKHPGRRAGTVEALRSADGVVAVSQDLAHHMVAMGAHPDRVRVIYCGVERHLFCPGAKSEARQAVGMTEPGQHLLFVGNLVPVKAVDVLLKACAKLHAEGMVLCLHVVGEGPLREKLINLSKELGIPDRVQWHGSIPLEKLPNWYRAADVFVLPSRSEGVPNVLLEASGCNTPWVSTRVGGIPEIEPLGVNRIVSPESIDELSGAIREILQAPARIGQPPRSPEEAVLETSQFLLEVQQMTRSSKLAVGV